LRDALRGGIGLLASQPSQDGLVLAIDEREFYGGINQQRRAHQPDEKE
jgi:hypothetical protein